MFLKNKFILITAIIVSSSSVLARPQYAARQREVSCTTCHFSPSGGGVKTLYGKTYGSRGLKLGVHSNTDTYSADVKAMAFGSIKETHKSVNGFGIMNATLASAVPVHVDQDGSELHAVGSYKAAGFGAGAGEIFARYQTTSNSGFLPKHVVVGKFNAPFGVPSGEHRTYTRRQTLTSTTDYETGLMLSSNIASNFHYDLALTNGFQKQGSQAPTSNDITWASFVNFRYIPVMGPLTLGASASYHKSLVRNSPSAYTLYGILALSRKSSFLMEVSYADGWNDKDINAQIPKFVDTDIDQDYYESIKDKKSVGVYSRFDYDFSKRVMLSAKIDVLSLDEKAAKDAYYNFGLSMRYWMLANADLDFRIEKSEIGNKSIDKTNIAAADDMAYVLIRMWL